MKTAAALLAAAAAVILLSGCGAGDPGPSADTAEACGHSWTTEQFSAPTCTENGRAEYTCRLCGQKLHQTFVAEGHRWSEFTVALPGADPAGDTMTRTCSVCGLWDEQSYSSAGAGDETVLDALAVLPAGKGTYYTAESAEYLESLLRIREARRGTLDDVQIGLLADEIRLARSELCYLTSDVPLVFLTTKEAPTAEYGDAEVVVVNTDGRVELSDPSALAHIHGNSTTVAKKKSYNLKLSAKAELLGVDKSKKWILIGNQFDCTRIRHALVYTLAKEMGMAYVPDFTFVEAYVNGEYWGSYLLVEKIDDSKNSVNVDTSSGDWMIEVERSRTEDGTAYLKTARYGVRLAINAPETPDEAATASLGTLLDNFEAALASRDYGKLCEVCDVSSFVDFYLINELVKDVDVAFSSTRFYVSGGRLYAGPVWDYDLALGNVNGETYKNYYRDSQDGTAGAWATNFAWFRELMKCPEFAALASARYEELIPVISGLYDDSTPGGSVIGQLVAKYGASFARTAKLSGCRFYAYSNMERIPDKTYEENVAYLVSWLGKRDSVLRGRLLK